MITYPKKASEGLKHFTGSKTDIIQTLQKCHYHGWLTIKKTGRPPHRQLKEGLLGPLTRIILVSH